MFTDKLHTILRLTPEFKIIFLIYAIIFLIAFAVLIYRKKSISNRSKYILIAIMVFVGLRMFIFNNPIFFKVASSKLKTEDIGWRQADVLRTDQNGFFEQGSFDYLAIGSSQVGAVFNKYAGAHKNFNVFSLAGMGTLDFVLYQPYIKHFNPKNIILYLSDFDLCRQPLISSATLAPTQPTLKLAKLIACFRKYNLTGSYGELIAANYLPEYRYQYILKGILEKYAGKNEAFPHQDAKKLSKEDHLELHFTRLATLNPEWIDINLELLSFFLKWCEKSNIQVFIVEGHYHPEALSKNIPLHYRVANQLESLTRSFKATYIKYSSVKKFNENDYKDGYHVYRESGYAFTEKLVHFLESGLVAQPKSSKLKLS